MALDLFEKTKPRDEIEREAEAKLDALREKEEGTVWLRSRTEELPDKHTEDPALDVPLSKKIEPKVLTRLVEMLSDASGFAVVTDDFRGMTGFKFEKGARTREVVDDICSGADYNWSRNDRVIELWAMDWYDRRQTRVSKAWLESLRRQLTKTGTLDIDSLAEIAQLTDDQFYKNISDDSILGCTSGKVVSKREYLKLYASLSADQRQCLFSDAGLAFSGLSQGQQQAIVRIVTGMNAPALSGLDLAGLGARVCCVRESFGKQYVYTMQAYTNLGQIPGLYRFRTPLYVEPPKPTKR
jgi:hypothetical protein